MSKFNEQYGPWAIVTGSSAGIGVEFAQQLAARGLNLVLVARRADLLEQLAEKLEHEHSIATRCVPLDLTAADFLPQLRRATADLNVGMLVMNTMMGLMPRRLDTAMMAMTMGRIEWKQAPTPGSSDEAQTVPSAALG